MNLRMPTLADMKPLQDCLTDAEILEACKNDENALHLVIASDLDECMGMISLEHIERETGTAEMLLHVRPEAKHRGYAWFAAETLLQRAFDELGLESVYWSVPFENAEAIRFFDKHYFHEVTDPPLKALERCPDPEKRKWYSVLKGDVLTEERETIAGCRVIHIKTIPTVDAGELSFFEGSRDLPFDIRRIYYISKVPEGTRRGYHAHRNLKQLLFCPYGRIQLILENKNGREEIELKDPSIGIVIDQPTWREMLWLQKDSVLCIAASEYYDEGDYIRDYETFRDEYLC